MLNLALSALDPILTGLTVSGQPLIEKYGGLAFPVTVKEEISRTDSGEPILKEKTYAVSCGINFEACMVGKRYQELCPSSAYRSLAYWEQTGNAQRNAAEEKNYKSGTAYVYDIPARLLVWMNIKKMNLNNVSTDCSIAAPVALAIQQQLDKRQGFPLDQLTYPGGTVTAIFQSEEVKDASRAFGRYSYGNITKFLLYPFDFFSLNYVIRLRISPKCLVGITLGAPVDC
jgi:hypothetical protein